MKLKDEAKEQRIKEATFQLVAEIGIAGITMSRVAKKAKISASMIYTYFKNKEDLIEQVFKEAVKRLTLKINFSPKDDLPYKAKVLHHFQESLRIKRNKSVEYSFFKNFLQSPYFKEDHRITIIQGFGKFIFELFEEGQKKMIVKDNIDLFLLVGLLDGFTEKLVEIHKNKAINLDEKNTNDAFSIFWDAIRQ